MKISSILISLLMPTLMAGPAAGGETPSSQESIFRYGVISVEVPPRGSIPNPQIDYAAFKNATLEAESMREQRRLDEATFLKMAAEPGTIIYDGRTAERFQRIHVKGAVNLAYTEITEETLTKLLGDKNTRVLIYCNNNFTGNHRDFVVKAVSLNVPTFITLYAHGYRNVYELGPALDIKTTKIPFEGTDVVKPVNSR